MISTPSHCSARGCRTAAVWFVVWRNQRLHGPDREKRWLACAAHRGPLASFLDARGFLLRVEPGSDAAAADAG